MGYYDWVDEYCFNKPGVTKELKEEWDAFRYMVGGKMFILRGEENTGRPVITVKVEPELGQHLRTEYKDKIIPGYYMNKEHWNSIYEDREVPREVVEDMLDRSYNLILKSLPKKKQKEILGE